MESLICRLDDDCDKLLICKLDLECKKMLHFHSEASVPRVSTCGLHYRCGMRIFCSSMLSLYTIFL